MSIAVHPVHRRLAEMAHTIKRYGGLEYAPSSLLREIGHIITINQWLVYEIDGLKTRSLLAYELEDVEWQHELCAKLEQLEVSLT